MGEERVSGWSLPSSLSPPINWCRNILDGQGHSPLVEGQLGFTLERREIMASLGKRSGNIKEGCSLLSLHWGICPILHLTCPVFVLYCIGPDLHLTCRASVLFCIHPVLNPNCTTSVLSCISPVLHPPCPAPELSCIRPFPAYIADLTNK